VYKRCDRSGHERNFEPNGTTGSDRHAAWVIFILRVTGLTAVFNVVVSPTPWLSPGEVKNTNQPLHVPEFKASTAMYRDNYDSE
jgi:hypothetical protein